jgi:hypothetical protein
MSEGGTPAAIETGAPVGRVVDECPECGYELTGLPDSGVCPECGEAYDQSMLVLHGAARGRFANLGNAAGRSVVAQIAWLILCIVNLRPLVGSSWRDPILMLVLAFAVGFAVLTVMRRFLADRAGLVQLYLRPDGFLQRDYDDRSLVYALYRVGWLVLNVAVLSLTLILGRDGLKVIGEVGLALAGLMVVGAVVFHSVTRTGRSNMDVFAHWRLPWRNVGRCVLEPVGDSRFRLRLLGTQRDKRPVLADLEFPCARERARRLEALINRWIAENFQRRLGFSV